MKTLIMTILAILGAGICLAADMNGISQPLHALDTSSLTFRRITAKEGLSGRIVFTICQDNEGYVWIGTDSGLDRYDGYNIVSYFHDNLDKNSVCNSCVTYIYESRDGRLWIGTSDGLCTYDKASDSFLTIEGTSSMYVRQISEDNKGCLWVATNKGCLMMKAGKWYRFHANAGAAFYIPDDYVTSIMPYDEDIVWISAGKYICTYSHKQGNFRMSPLPSITSEMKNKQIFWLSKGSKDEIFIGTNEGLFQYVPSSGECKLMLNEVVRSISLKDGTLWVATQNGLHIGDGNSFHHYYHIPGDNSSLADNLVWAVDFSKDGNAWIATENGVSVTNTNRPLPFVSLKSLVRWDISANVQCLLKDSTGRIWLGTTHGIIWYNPESDGDYNGKEMFQGYNVRDIYEDKDGYMWIATDGGLFSYSILDGKTASYKITEPSGQYRSDWMYSILEDSSGSNIWIGTFDGGIFVINKQRLLLNWKEEPVTADNHYSTSSPTHRLSSNLISGLALDGKGNIWASTNDRGLCRIDAATGNVTEYSMTNSGLESNNIGGFKTGSDGTIWIYTDAGIFRLDPDSRTISRSVETISGKVLDMAVENEYLWITSNTGLIRYNTENGSLYKINTGDAVCDAIYYDGDKTVYIGCKNGFISIDTSTMPADTIEEVSITGISVNGIPARSKKNRDSGVSVDKSPEGVMSISLPYHCDNLSVQVSTFRFTDARNTTFVYKLEGYDNKVNYMSGSNTISYRDLRPGKYTLRISAGEFMPGHDGTLLHVTIKRPWYASTMAFALYALILLSTGVYIYKNVSEKRRKNIIGQGVCDSLTEITNEQQDALQPSMPRASILVLGTNPNEGIFGILAKISSDSFAYTWQPATSFENIPIKSAHPDMILIDDTLPDRECIHACHRFKANDKTADIPLIVVRKIAKQTDMRNFHLFGADLTISLSDTTPEHIETKIRNFIADKSKKHEGEDLDSLFMFSLMKAINDNIDNENLDTDMLCNILKTGRKQLYRKTMQLTGTTAAEYIKILRLQKASDLCRNTDLNISEIIMQVGFSSHSYFTKCFKEEYHTTPKEYINMYRENIRSTQI